LTLGLTVAVGWAAETEPGRFASAAADFDPAARTATVKITNIGAQAIIAGAVRVAFKYSDGSETASQPRFDLLPGVGLEGMFATQAPKLPQRIGALQPGQTYQFQQAASLGATGIIPIGASADVGAVVFMDNAAVGDSQAIDGIFHQWRDQGITFSAWYNRFSKSLETGTGVAALQQLSGDAKTMMALHPAIELRVYDRVPTTDEERLTRHSPTLEEMARLFENFRANIETHAMSEPEGLESLKEYLRLRTETTTAHAYRKGGK